jgi:hypothetical protein
MARDVSHYKRRHDAGQLPIIAKAKSRGQDDAPRAAAAPTTSVASQQAGLTASQHVGCWARGQPPLLERQPSSPSGVAPEAAGHVIGQAAVAEVDRQRPSAEALAPNRNSKVRGEPAVHDEYLARDVGGLVRRQERRRTRDFGRVSPATQGCSTANPTLHRGILCLLGI